MHFSNVHSSRHTQALQACGTSFLHKLLCSMYNYRNKKRMPAKGILFLLLLVAYGYDVFFRRVRLKILGVLDLRHDDHGYHHGYLHDCDHGYRHDYDHHDCGHGYDHRHRVHHDYDYDYHHGIRLRYRRVFRTATS